MQTFIGFLSMKDHKLLMLVWVCLNVATFFFLDGGANHYVVLISTLGSYCLVLATLNTFLYISVIKL